MLFLRLCVFERHHMDEGGRIVSFLERVVEDRSSFVISDAINKLIDELLGLVNERFFSLYTKPYS